MESRRILLVLNKLNSKDLWLFVSIAVTLWSLVATVLAQVGHFRPFEVTLSGLLAGLGGWAGERWGRRPVGAQGVQESHRGEFIPIFLLLVGLLLFCWPAEHFPLLGDSAIYPNTATMLARTGGLTYYYDPLDGLTSQQKQLFYIPSDWQLPYIKIQSYQGLLYRAYYVMDPKQNIVVSSRQPLVIVWMALFQMILGPRGMLLVPPLFGAASLVTLYFLGRRLFGPASATLAALLLGLSFPQLHFSRTPYAEIVGQFFILVSLAGWVGYLRTRRITDNLLGIGALAAAFAARIDALIGLAPLVIFIGLLILQKDWRGLLSSFGCAVLMSGFAIWTANRPYVGATAELLMMGQLRFLGQMGTGEIAGLGAGGLLGLLLVGLTARRLSPVRLQRVVRWVFSISVIAGLVYGLHIRPFIPEMVAVGDQLLPTYNEEIMAITARYVSPLLFWAAALGLVLIIWQKRVRSEHVLLIGFVISFGVVFFWKYTTARVYPVALRRLVPEVLPGMALLAAFALCWLGKRRRWRWLAIALAGLIAVLLLGVAGPYWFYHEAMGTWDFLKTLAEHLPEDAMVLFEPQQNESFVGWFAAPLWSFYGRKALLLNSGDLNEKALQGAIYSWACQGKEVYVVSQTDPTAWWPGEFRGHLTGDLTWNSTIIGQSRRFPPYVWRFTFTFQIYRYEANCPSADNFPLYGAPPSSS